MDVCVCIYVCTYVYLYRIINLFISKSLFDYRSFDGYLCRAETFLHLTRTPSLQLLLLLLLTELIKRLSIQIFEFRVGK